MATVVEPSFALGELSDALSGRIDMEWYGKGLARAKNFYILPSGGATLRPGTEYVGPVPDMSKKSRLVPFVFNGDIEDTYALLFNNGRVYPIQDGGFVLNNGSVYSFECAFSESELPYFDYAQSGDVLYITHANRPVRKIMRNGHTDWTVETPNFMPKINAPTSLTATTNHDTPSSESDATVTYRYKVTAMSSDGDESAPTSAVSIDSRNLGLDNTQITLSWTATATDTDHPKSASEYKIYKDVGGTFGLVGYSTTTSWKDKNYDADLSVTPLSYKNPFNGSKKYPSCVGFVQQRLVFAGTKNDPQKVWMSRSGNFENFGQSNPTQDDDAIYISIYSRQVSWIRALVSMRGLCVLTGGTEYTMNAGSVDAVLTPSECRASQQSSYGCSRVHPVSVGNSIIMLQRGGHTVRDMAYDYSVDGYQGNDLSIRSSHLLHGYTITSWCYQTNPDGILWAVRNDGKLLSLTYNKEHQIFAWTRHETDGRVEDVCCVASDDRDEVYMVVRRKVNGAWKRYVERLAEPFRDLEADTAANAWYVDCGLKYSGSAVSTLSGLSHLEGKTVAVLADGGPINGIKVQSGSITLPREYSTIIVGLPYEGFLKSLRVNGSDNYGPSQGRRQKIGDLKLRFDRTVGGDVGWERYGTDGDVLEEKWAPIKYRTLQQANEPSAPFSGDREARLPAGWDNRGQFMLRQRDPLPMTLLCAILNVTLGEK